ncbi:unnamed protein product [Dicrocoelium dendriticum]|nr:unnamed protein product [Dicrocoelium dendriticum]
MLKLGFIPILVVTLLGYSGQQHSPHSIRIERNTNWPAADHEFAKRLPTWSQEIQHFLKSLENTHQLTSSDIRMVYGRCASSPKHLDAHQVEHSAYIINQSEFCVLRPQMKLLIVVHSHPSNTHRRHLIRSTWASMRRVALEQIATIFFLGRATSEAQQQKIEEENQLFQ